MERENNKLLDILRKRLEPSELKTLAFRVLGNGSYDNLPGYTHDEKCIALLENVSRRLMKKLLLQELADLRPDIDLSDFEIPHEPEQSLPELEPTPFIAFANRKVEWERVVLYPTGQYYLFDAPAGYGKTALLKKLEEEFKRRGWRCAYVSLETSPSFPEIAQQLFSALEIQSKVHRNPQLSGFALGSAISARKDDKTGLVLLFDVDHLPSTELRSTLSALLNDFVPRVWEALTENSESFRYTSNNYRVVLAGRYLASKIDALNLSYEFDTMRLTPFDYQVVQNICRNYLNGRLSSIEECDEFAAHLLFYSGGHPRCMVRTMQLFEQHPLATAEFFTRYREKIEDIACDEAIRVRRSIDRQWRSVFDALCVYRRFDSKLIQQLVGLGSIRQSLGKGPLDMIGKLLRLYLVDWRSDSAYRHLSDGITRRLLSIYLQHDKSSNEVSDAYEQARHFCLNYLDTSGDLRHIWALEALFSYLQVNLIHIDTQEERHSLYQDFFEQQLPLVLQTLVKDCDPRCECRPFKQLLVGDWEFRFVLNYYLRDNVYTDAAYQRLLEYVDRYMTTD